MDFVDYTTGASGVVVKAGGPDYAQLGDLCGLKVGVLRGSVDASILPQQKCGARPMKLSIFNDYPAVLLAVTSGRVQAAAGDASLFGLRAKRAPSSFKLTRISYAQGTVGISLPKHSALEQPLLRATQAIMDSGRLKAIHAKWGAPQLALRHASINHASS